MKVVNKLTLKQKNNQDYLGGSNVITRVPKVKEESKEGQLEKDVTVNKGTEKGTVVG